MLLSKIFTNRKHIKKVNFSQTKYFIRKMYFLIKNYKSSEKSKKHFFKSIEGRKTLSTQYRNDKLISYIIIIKMSLTNTLINLMDIKGNLVISLSAGQINLKGKQKRKQPMVLIALLKELIIKTNFIGNRPVALHFKNTKSYHESLVISMLSEKFFIQFIKSYNLLPHNGCRPKKLKRLKNRS